MVSHLKSVSMSIDVQFNQLRFDMATHGSQRLPVLLAVHGFNVINAEQRAEEPDGRVSVSYTHLTLPTICSV